MSPGDKGGNSNTITHDNQFVVEKLVIMCYPVKGVNNAMNERDILLRIMQIKKRIAQLPVGTVVYKKIKGKDIKHDKKLNPHINRHKKNNFKFGCICNLSVRLFELYFIK